MHAFLCVCVCVCVCVYVWLYPLMLFSGINECLYSLYVTYRSLYQKLNIKLKTNLAALWYVIPYTATSQIFRPCRQNSPLKHQCTPTQTKWSHIPAQNLKSFHNMLCSVGRCAGQVESPDCGWRKQPTVMESSSMFVGPHFVNVRQWVITWHSVSV